MYQPISGFAGPQEWADEDDGRSWRWAPPPPTALQHGRSVRPDGPFEHGEGRGSPRVALARRKLPALTRRPPPRARARTARRRRREAPSAPHAPRITRQGRARRHGTTVEQIVRLANVAVPRLHPAVHCNQLKSKPLSASESFYAARGMWSRLGMSTRSLGIAVEFGPNISLKRTRLRRAA